MRSAHDILLLGGGRARHTGSGLVAQDDVDAIVDAFDTDGLDGWAWATAGLTFAGAIALAIGLKWVLTRLLCKRMDRALAILVSRLVAYVVIVIGLTYSLGSLGVRVAPLLGALGIAGIALAFALKDILENFVAGVMIQLRRPFTYGDEVQIGERAGRVEDIDARLVTIVTPDGETVLVPSAVVIKAEVTNLTAQGGRRTDLEIGVAYGTDLRRAQEVLNEAVRSVELVRTQPEPQVLLTGFGDSSIDFVVRYWHDPTIAVFWQARSDVAFAVEAALAEADITIPFPQRTLWWGADADG